RRLAGAGMARARRGTHRGSQGKLPDAGDGAGLRIEHGRMPRHKLAGATLGDIAIDIIPPEGGVATANHLAWGVDGMADGVRFAFWAVMVRGSMVGFGHRVSLSGYVGGALAGAPPF